MDWFIGEIRLFAFSRVPVSWVACDGRALAISEYTTLYSLIGSTYGGDGQTTFKVPDLRGRVPVSFGQVPGHRPYSLGEAAGFEHVTLITAEMPAHDHGLQSTVNPATTATPGTKVHLATITPDTKTLYAPATNVTAYDVMASTSIRNTGGGGSHNNMMPSLVMNYCISTDGIYPRN